MAPSRAQVLIMAAPIPFAPPVTSTTLSLSCRSMENVGAIFELDRTLRGEILAAKIQETSVNRIVRTRDEGCFVGAQKEGKGSDLFRLSHSPNRLRFF